MKLYSIHDLVAKEYCDPFCAKNDDVAIRQFNLCMKQSRVENPEEYQLVLLGEFDRDLGEVYVDAVPTILNTNIGENN